MSTHDSTVTADISGPARELGVMDSRFRKPPPYDAAMASGSGETRSLP